MKFGLFLLMLVHLAPAAAPYSAERRMDGGIAVVRLTDSVHQAEVTVVPSFGNRAVAFLVKGKNILYFPWQDAEAFGKSGRKQLNGVPFLAPWANRMAGGGFWADDKHYRFNPEAGTVQVSPDQIAMHGLLTASELWEVVSVQADARSAQVTSRMALWKHPELMENWPFAHEYEMTYRLRDGVLEVRTKVTNVSAARMPIAVGFHPYFVLPDVERSTASIHLPVREHVKTDSRLVATGEFEPASLPEWISLSEHTFDDGYRGLVKDDKGQVVFSVRSGKTRIDVRYGPRYQAAVVYVPPRQPFLCFEPMSSITNGVNLAHEGKYPELQTVAPGESWVESFWISATI